jgi:hypothetical protein
MLLTAPMQYGMLASTLKAMTETSTLRLTDQRIRVWCEPGTGPGRKILLELQAERASSAPVSRAGLVPVTVTMP